jgi:hypothetical protein
MFPFRAASGMDLTKSDLTESVYHVVVQTSIPAQIRELTLYISENKGQVDGFVRESTFAERLHEHFP